MCSSHQPAGFGLCLDLAAGRIRGLSLWPLLSCTEALACHHAATSTVALSLLCRKPRVVLFCDTLKGEPHLGAGRPGRKPRALSVSWQGSIWLQSGQGVEGERLISPSQLLLPGPAGRPHGSPGAWEATSMTEKKPA